MNPSYRLVRDTKALLHEAAGLYADQPPIAALLRSRLEEWDAPLRVAIAGHRGTGKSTLVNALVGGLVAPVRPHPVPVHYHDGPELRVRARFRRAPAYQIPAVESAGGVDLSLPRAFPETLDHLTVEWPARTLRGMTLIDTPALADVGEPGDDPLPNQLAEQADATIYLARHLDPTLLATLRPAQRARLDLRTPIDSLLVLSRADELGTGRVDSLVTGRRLARRARKDQPACRPFQSVIAVSATLALAGRQVFDEEFADLGALAGLPRAELDRALLSVAEFLDDQQPAGLSRETRTALLGRFGLSGVRLATTLRRTGADTPRKLASELVRRSGLSQLRDAVSVHLLSRTEVLRARSALRTLDGVLRSAKHREGERLTERIEAIISGAHEFAELRLLAELESGRLSLPSNDGPENEGLRLLGAYGIEVHERLGLAPDSTATTLVATAEDALRRWRRITGSQSADREQQRIGETLVRSCEGVLGELLASTSG